jgi:hypothetical protein
MMTTKWMLNGELRPMLGLIANDCMKKSSPEKN